MWTDDALCREYDARWWFSDEKASRERAKEVCAECPVSALCVAGAVERDERFGIWGGRDFGAGERHKKYRARVTLQQQKRRVA